MARKHFHIVEHTSDRSTRTLAATDVDRTAHEFEGRLSSRLGEYWRVTRIILQTEHLTPSVTLMRNSGAAEEFAVLNLYSPTGAVVE